MVNVKMNTVPANIEESGIIEVFSYIWEYRKKSYIRFSLFPQLYLFLIIFLVCLRIIMAGMVDFIGFVFSFFVPGLIGYGITTAIYVILYVDVIREEKQKRSEKFKTALSANPTRSKTLL